MNYRVAIVGCGNIAGGYDRVVSSGPGAWSFTHAGAYQLCTGTDLVAVCDIDSQAREAFGRKWGVKKSYGDVKEMIQKERPDIVSICTPTRSHHEVFKTLCHLDVPAIFCEKPLAYRYEEALAMQDLAGQRIVAVNYFRRYNETFEQLRGKIRDQFFGRELHATAYYSKGFIHNASHFINLLMWFFGEVDEAQVERVLWQGDEDAGIDFRLTFKSGLVADVINVQGAAYTIFDMDILFENGRVILGQRGQEIAESGTVEEPHYRQFKILGIASVKPTAWQTCMQQAVEDIVSCLKNGGRPRCGIPEGLATLSVCEQLKSQLQ